MKWIIAVIIVGLAAASLYAQDAQPALVVDTVNVRADAAQNSALIGRIAVRSAVLVEARNRFGDWVLVHNEDSSLRGWVASRFVFWDDGIALENLSVSTETFIVAPVTPVLIPASTGADTANTPLPSVTSVVPTTDGLSPRAAELVTMLSGVPILPTMTERIRQLYAENIAAGRDPHNFAKIGDCNTENRIFMSIFARGEYTLGDYSALEESISYYQQGYDSFSRQSLAGRIGHLATTVIDPIYADTVKCPNMSMLQCEYHQQNPAVSLIMLGMADSYRMDPATFRAGVNQIASDSIAQKVLPVFFTVPANANANSNFEKTMEFNLALVEVANSYGIPVVNLWLASQAIPGSGATADAIHPTSNDLFAGDFTGSQNTLGFTLWNLLALQTLDLVRTLQ